jgi:hypothetical protein
MALPNNGLFGAIAGKKSLYVFRSPIRLKSEDYRAETQTFIKAIKTAARNGKRIILSTPISFADENIYKQRCRHIPSPWSLP